MERKFAFRDCFQAFRQVFRKRDIWLLIAGGVIGFIAVTGYFWITIPHEYLNQTVFMQSRPNVTIPTFIAMTQNVFFLSSYYGRLAYLPIILSLPVVLLILNKRDRSPSQFFIATAMLTALVFCQAFPSEPRYTVSAYMFLLLAIGSLIPSDIGLARQDFRSLAPGIKAGFLSVATVFTLFISSSTILLTNYGGYDINSPIFASNEEEIYKDTISYLESVSPKKLFSANPIFPAMSFKLRSTLDIDVFAALYLKTEGADKLVRDKIDEGVDYIVLDAWARYWNDTPLYELVNAVREQSRLVMVIAPESSNRIEIYSVAANSINVFNGDFTQWAIDGAIRTPLGWQPIASIGTDENGDFAGILNGNIGNKDCVRLIVSEDGRPDGTREATQVGIYQEINFPEKNIVAEVFPSGNTRTDTVLARPTGIHFRDKAGHNIVFGFSDSIDSEQILMSPDGNSMMVLRPARLGEWSLQTIDLASYWSKTIWDQPKKVTIWLIASAYYTEPGIYDFCVAGIGEE